MTAITAGLVKDLREKSGAGMMDCKKALVENSGDLEASFDWLRKKGLAAAAKKSGRTAAAGLIGVSVKGDTGCIVEINSETDFVGRNEKFQAFVSTVSGLVSDAGGDVEKLKQRPYPGNNRSVSEELTELITVIGENMTIRRAAQVNAKGGIAVSYIHSAVGPNMGRIGVLVGIQSKGDKATLETLGKKIAMHIAATAPQSLNVDELDASFIERERKVLREQAQASGKPAEVVDKMIEGRLRKFYEEVVLLEQVFVMDGKAKVREVIEQVATDLGTEIKLTEFVRFTLGEGIEKKEGDFAKEVAAQLGQ